MRLIDIIFFGLLLFGVSFISYQVTRIPSLSVQLGIFCFCAPFIFASYTDAMSESLFYFFMVLGLLCLLLHLEKKSPSVLIFSAAFASGAFLTRYIGIAIPIACILGILFLSQQGWKNRIYNAFIYSLISIGPCLIWLLWIFLGTSNLGHRVARNTVDLWASSIDFRKGLFLVIWDWLTLGTHENASYDVQKLSIVLFFCVIGVLCVFLFYKTIRRPEKSQYLVLIHWVMLFCIDNGCLCGCLFSCLFLNSTPTRFD
jgi:4-amino-4-deoxy-L-arabinose transferase-like glycosyltransferase